METSTDSTSFWIQDGRDSFWIQDGRELIRRRFCTDVWKRSADYPLNHLFQTRRICYSKTSILYSCICYFKCDTRFSDAMSNATLVFQRLFRNLHGQFSILIRLSRKSRWLKFFENINGRRSILELGIRDLGNKFE